MYLLRICLAVLVATASLEAQTDGPKPGDNLGTIITTNGTVYAGAKLQSIEPDGITILDSDGGAKISFEKLPSDLQKRFGYDTQKAAAYAQQEIYEQQIAELQDEVARLRSELANYKGALTSVQSRPKDSVAAYHAFLYQKVVAFVQGGVVHGGEYDRMMEDKATAYAKQKWITMSEDEKAVYEKIAEQTGDPIVEAANKPPETYSSQGNGAPPAADPNPPSTTTVIDPQTGNTAIIVH